MDAEVNKKRGQVTIFVIVAIIIVVAVIALFIFLGKDKIQQIFPGGEQLNPQQYITKCAKDAVSPYIDYILQGGGEIMPKFFQLYRDEKYNYVCYQKNFYLACINQYPMLNKYAEDQIKNETEDKIIKCYESLKSDYSRKGYSISEGELNYNIEVVSKKVIIKVNKELRMTKEGISQEFNGIETYILSPMYDLLDITSQVINQESQYCNFEYNGFMLMYPQYDILKIPYDNSDLYRIKDRQSGKEIKFAVRGCALPAGI